MLQALQVILLFIGRQPENYSNEKGDFFLLASALIYKAGGMRLTSSVRGIRNNNPGNIRWDGVTQWEGMTGHDDKGFIVFSDVEYGIRAMARVLASYSRRGIDTVAGIVSTWAPPNENDTDSYIDSVVSRTGLDRDRRLSSDSYSSIIAALIHHENGMSPYSMALIDKGVSMA